MMSVHLYGWCLAIAVGLGLGLGGYAQGRSRNITATKRCQRGEPCWPTKADIAALTAALDPSASRVLRWDGQPNPRVCAVPIYSPYEQPLYGFGVYGLQPVYYAEEAITDLCFSKSPETRPVCLAACRDNPLEGWHPAIVVFALTAEHVQTAVRFAVKHNMCINVAGTGHDFLNRHSCDEGVFIRTTLLKDIEWDLTDRKGFGHRDGNVRLGAGIVFSEAQKSASDNARYISSGWAITVGVVGWSIGGGHGPFAPSSGLGVDNILEVEIVTAEGNLVTASASENSDLFWALRGGGGSAWGVITAVTLRAHANPVYPFEMGKAYWIGTNCPDDRGRLHSLVDAYLAWALTLDKRWSGIMFFTPMVSDDSQCDGNWTAFMQYTFIGPEDEANSTWLKFTDAHPPIFQGGNLTKTWWEQVEIYPLEPIWPIPALGPSEGPGGVPSVLVSRDEVVRGSLAAQVKSRIDDCANKKKCARQELYQDITGNIGSIQDPNVSISPGFRKAMFHFVVGQWDAETMKTYYSLGENSYLSESAYTMDGDSWKNRYWGSNYEQLLNIKKKWDPNGVFWCHHCVGSDL